MKVTTEETPAVGESHPEPEPVTPVNLPLPVDPAVTPMVVPPSAITVQEGLLDVDAAVSRQVIEAVLEVQKEGEKEVEIAGEEDSAVAKVEDPVGPLNEVIEPVVVLEDAPIVASPPDVTPPVEAAEPVAKEVVSSKEGSKVCPTLPFERLGTDRCTETL